MIDRLSERISESEVDQNIIQFFAAFDDSQLEKIQKLNQKLVDLKAKNRRDLNKQALDCTERSELENLLLDAVEECKRDVIKRRAEISTSQFYHFKTGHLKEGGVSG